METGKSNVLKSKSSNSAIPKSALNGQKTMRCDQNKKSRSSADFPPIVGHKKKSMYVEKRSTRASLTSQGKSTDAPAKPKAPPPRRGKGKFLNSVLTILDQDTQGTQTGTSREMKRKNTRPKKKPPKAPYTDLTVENVGESAIPELRKSQQFAKEPQDPEIALDNRGKDKFRSKVLKEELFRRDTEKLFIMAPKPISCPANSDEDNVECQKRNNIYCHVAEGLLGQILDDKKGLSKEIFNDFPFVFQKDFEPETLVGGFKNEKFNNVENQLSGQRSNEKGGQGLSSFFMDLLDKTYDVDNNNPSDEENVSDKLVMDDVVAKKLEFITPEDKPADVDRERDRQTENERDRTDGYSVRDDLGWNESETFKAAVFSNMQESRPPYCRPFSSRQPQRNDNLMGNRKRLKSASFSYTPENRDLAQTTQSFIMSRKPTKKKKKETLLSILKEELMKPIEPLDEPETMFQALKVLARNKRRHRITFADTKTEVSSSDYSDHYSCRFQGRKVICSSKKPTRRNKKTAPPRIVRRPSVSMESESEYPRSRYGDTNVDMAEDMEYGSSYQIRGQQYLGRDMEDDNDGSYQTLEVYERDTHFSKKLPRKEIFFTRNPYLCRDDVETVVERQLVGKSVDAVLVGRQHKKQNKKASVESVGSSRYMQKGGPKSESTLGSEIEYPSDLSLPDSEQEVSAYI